MRFEHLQYIIEISKTGSFTAAAKQLNISQPNMSQGVFALEQELGVKLFNRSRTGAQATEAGKAIILKAIEILNKTEELKEIADVQSSLLTGRLSIAAIPALSVSLLPKTLGVYKQKFPGVELVIKEDGTQQILQDLDNGIIDIGLIGIHESIDTNKFVVKRFMTSKILACVGKNSEFSRHTKVSLKEIIKQPIISTSEHVIQTLSKYGQPRHLFISKNLEAAKHVIAEGMAIGFYSELSLKFDPYVHMGEIIPLPIIEEEMDLLFCWVHAKNHYSNASQQFIKELQSQIEFIKRIYNL